MKQYLWIPILCLCLLLTACIAESSKGTEGTGPYDATASTEDVSASVQITYYQDLITSLREDLLDAKAALYIQRVEYESRLDALTREDSVTTEKPSATTPSEGTDPEEEPPTTLTPPPSEPTELFLYTLSEGRATVTGYTGKATTVTVPETLGGCPVTAIADDAFRENTALTQVTLPENLARIGWFAFYGCVSLREINIPAGVTVISYGAFEHCHKSLVLAVAADSYGEQYAASYGIGSKRV